MKKLLMLSLLLISLMTSCLADLAKSDPEYPIGTVLYIMPDSTKAVASGGVAIDGFLWVQYTTKFGNISERTINKKLIYK